MMSLFKARVKARGVKGIIGLQKLFKIMDDDNSNCLSQYEFSKACRDFKVGISEDNLPVIFNAFDLNHDGTLSIDEFLMAVRGDLNRIRLNAVKQAFKKIDREGNGSLELASLKELFNADRYPDVISGRRTSDQVLVEFIETFETQLDIMHGRDRDGYVTLEDFTEYYRNVSSAIDEDDEFLLIINNSWISKAEADPY